MAAPNNDSFPGDDNGKPHEENAEPKDEASPDVTKPATTSSARVLDQEEVDRLAGELTLVSDFKLMKLEKDAQKNWDLFYKRNSTNFFKDRHWTSREFKELKACRKVRLCVLHLLSWVPLQDFGRHETSHRVPSTRY